MKSQDSKHGGAAPSRGCFANSGNGPTLVPIEIGHDDYLALIDPDTAFWSLVGRGDLAGTLGGGKLLNAYRRKAAAFADEMQTLRFGLKPSAVYFNPTERCNLDCKYCYIPRDMRRDGEHMPPDRLMDALARLKAFFARTAPKGRRPQIVFHGAEPMLAREAVFAGIDAFADDFLFGVQTNATLLDESAVKFLVDRNVSIGLSLDGPTSATADRTRTTWAGRGVFDHVVAAMDRLRGYANWSVIATVTSENLRSLTKLVDFFHRHEAPTCMLNVVRCTLPASRKVKPDDASAAKYFIAALDRTYELFQRTGRKLPVANFANILLAILAPTARRLMCDISPCGGGRCFFALAPDGGMFPCSEFIGLDSFRGGNLFTDDIESVLASKPFQLVTGRKVEDIDPCRRCAIRHFCGSPCPAEAHEMNGGMGRTGAFCEFYEEQVRYAFRQIADSRQEAFLWDDWDAGMKTTFAV
ncbi:MAG: peptide-modifying radical SAM enzyme CbpB [Phycisphaerae bacterium]|nr:peptide-modifying radical SAM enzyme CbpB [Phycisphaerae bacterium]